MTHAEAIRSEDSLIRGLARQLGLDSFGTGPMAALRRMDPRQPAAAPPALHRLLACLPSEFAYGCQYGRWMLIVHGLAIAAPEHHRGGRALGAALFAAGCSEGRLTRLLVATETDLPVVLPRMVRFLVAHGERLDPFELARLILRRDKSPCRLRIARDYYRAEAHLSAAR